HRRPYSGLVLDGLDGFCAVGGWGCRGKLLSTGGVCRGWCAALAAPYCAETVQTVQTVQTRARGAGRGAASRRLSAAVVGREGHGGGLASRRCDVSSPWSVGNGMTMGGQKHAATGHCKDDPAEAKRAGMAYLPVLDPPFGWRNLTGEAAPAGLSEAGDDSK